MQKKRGLGRTRDFKTCVALTFQSQLIFLAAHIIATISMALRNLGFLDLLDNPLLRISDEESQTLEPGGGKELHREEEEVQRLNRENFCGKKTNLL